MIDITKLPSIQSVKYNPIQFRGKTSSSDYNEYHTNSYFDILNLYNVANEFNHELTQMSMAHCIEALYIEMNKEDQTSIIEELESNYKGLRYGDKRVKYTYLNLFQSLDADINLEFNQINLPTYTSTSKLYLFDREVDVITIPKTLKYELSYDKEYEDTDFLNCIRGYSNKFFIRKIITNECTPCELDIEVTLPDNIISTRDINMISIIPYPYGSVDIMTMEYQYHGSWHRIPSFTSHSCYNGEYIPKAKAIKLCFPKTPMNKIRIKLRQENYIEEHEMNSFYIGLKSLVVNYDLTKEKKCTFNYDISFENIGEKITIHSLTPVYNNSDVLYNPKGLLDYDIFVKNEDGEYILLEKKFPLEFENTEIRIVSNLYYDSKNEVNPSFVKYLMEYNYENDGKLGNGNNIGNGNSGDNNKEDNTPCDCIFLDLVFNGDTITIGGKD